MLVSRLRPAVLALAALTPSAAAAQEFAAPSERGHLHGLIGHLGGHAEEEYVVCPPNVTIHDLAKMIDHLDRSLFRRGQVVVKNPDVWGQNRLTKYRAEYEGEMAKQLPNFEILLSGYQRRADLAALTSATSIGASLTPQIRNSRNVSTTTNVTVDPASEQATPAVPSAAGLLGPAGLAANANTLIGTMSPLLQPGNLTSLALANKGTAGGVGLEPTVLLDERSRFINHLHQLRRTNIGDDRSDMPGYSLYLVRTPVSLLPGAQSVQGKGAMVTVEAKHDLTPDLLQNTFRNVVILETAYQLVDVVTRGQYLPIREREDCYCQADLRDLAETDPAIRAREMDVDERIDRFRREGWAEEEIGAKVKQELRDTSNFVGPAIEKLVDSRMEGLKFRDSPIVTPGLTSGASGDLASSEVAALYGEVNLRKLVCAVKGDREKWYRHDPSVVSWLLSELASAHAYMREQARVGHVLFQPEVFENLGSLALMRDYHALEFHREKWLQALAEQRHEKTPDGLPVDGPGVRRIRPIDILAFALMVQSVAVDRQLKNDMQVMIERKGCQLGDPFQYTFYGLHPDEGAKAAFSTYVASKWPIHVFSLDPVVDQQNQLDLLSRRTELQLALATAIATGQSSFQNASSYARRLEEDLATIDLHRTAVGFGAGKTTFGWRFYPRLQTPPTESNPRRILNILANNGPGGDYALKTSKIEPGQRECYALMVVPNFIPKIRFSTVTNWFDLKTKHPDQELRTTDMVHLGRKLQVAREAMQRVCDSGLYRPTDIEHLSDRLSQLESLLPLQSHEVELPFEADLTGAEIFNSNNSGLGPRLLAWYGEPPIAGADSSIFILGTGFTVQEMRVIAGGQTLDARAGFELLSRNVMRIVIPKTAVASVTNAELPKEELHLAKNRDELGAVDRRRKVIDVHVASPNGVSNHLLVEVRPGFLGGENKDAPKTVSTTVTSTTKTDPDTGAVTQSTEIRTNPPGIVLPPGTYLPLGGNLPAGAMVAPGAATMQGNPPAFSPGTVPNTHYPAPPPQQKSKAVEDAGPGDDGPEPEGGGLGENRPNPPKGVADDAVQRASSPAGRPRSDAPQGRAGAEADAADPKPGAPRRKSILSRMLGR